MNDGPGEHHRAVPQQACKVRSEAVEASCLHRAANSNETAAQRIHRQQAVMGSQLQRIEESLGRTTNGQATMVAADRPQRGFVGDDLLLGVGSQFASGSDPAPLTTKHGHRGHQ